MKIQLIRHATLFLNYNGKQILVDPMLSPQGAMTTVANAANTLRNPLVNLQVDVSDLLAADAILLTHSHRDHFDDVAAALLPKDTPFFCQPEDAGRIRDLGFTQVIAIETTLEWDGVHIERTRGQHGRGEMAEKMGPVSGYLLSAPGEPLLYIAGDTVWCSDVDNALQHQPDVAVVYAGAAQFLTGGVITMDGMDISEVCRHAPSTEVVVAHMEAWSHCLLKRPDLAQHIREAGFEGRVHIPADGEEMEFNVCR